ncbi:E3 ubiquitin-protein ligase TRIM71-like [Amphiura filiformis]|uniref:E3 ubiquitin-protein ligase TRIM71-like n=1 Tax=Amphiura filiformis TaxID=82378 RepID=UPI003B225F7C
MAASLSQLSVLSQISEEFLLCQVCFERFSNPKILPCLHSFCEPCLPRYVARESRTIRCPMCKQDTELPENGVAGLKDNFFILNLSDVFTPKKDEGPVQKAVCTICVGTDPAEASYRCLECVDFLCDECAPSHDHRIARFSRQHHIISVPASENKKLLKRRDYQCEKHQSDKMRFFCEECQRPICRECILIEHKDHSHTYLKDEVTKHRNTIDALMLGVREKIVNFEDALQNIDEAEANLEANCGQAEYIIEKSVQEFIQQLRVQQQEYQRRLQRISNSRKKQLNAHRKSIQTGLENLLSGFDFTEKALGHGSELQILSIKDEVIDRLQGLSTISPQLDMTLDQLSQVYFVANDLSTDSNALPPLGQIRCGDKSGTDSSEATDTRSVCSLESSECGDSSISESLPPKSPKRSVPAESPKPGVPSKPQLLFHLKDETNEDGEFDWPSGVSVTNDGEYIAVVDRDNDRIQVYNKKGRFECKFGSRGRGPCQFELPLDVTITNDDDQCIYVTDEYNHRVQKLTLYGKYITHFGDNGLMKQPYGIALDAEGRVIVTDIGKHRITIHSPNGELLHTFGSRGDGDCQFNEPRYVTTSEDKIVVSDHCNHCVKIFSSSGTHLRTFGSCGSGNGQFIGPTGVCIDKEGNIIVADCADRIQLFNPEGMFIKHLLNENDGLSGPLGMSSTVGGELVITNLGTHCVNVFKHSSWV